MILSGRGWGKTRTGAETVRQWIKEGYNFVNLIAPTADDARAVMIEGESGILAVCPDDERPIYNKNACKLTWKNGATSLIFSAENPERERGKQHMKLWMDELCAWSYPQEAYDQAMFGLRLGDNPQAIITTTPKPIPVLKELVKQSTTYLTIGSTHDNRENLAPSFFSNIIAKYEGTRLGRQEINAEILEDNPYALWKREWIKYKPAPTDITQLVIGVDPSGSADGDEIGIVCVGRGRDGFYYVLDDITMHGTPEQWRNAVEALYRRRRADKVVAEKNFGGDMVLAVLTNFGQNGVNVKLVNASRGSKAVRAEPVSALYEQGKVFHVKPFIEMEDELCTWIPGESKKSPNRLDALVWALTSVNQDRIIRIEDYVKVTNDYRHLRNL